MARFEHCGGARAARVLPVVVAAGVTGQRGPGKRKGVTVATTRKEDEGSLCQGSLTEYGDAGGLGERENERGIGESVLAVGSREELGLAAHVQGR